MLAVIRMGRPGNLSSLLYVAQVHCYWYCSWTRLSGKVHVDGTRQQTRQRQQSALLLSEAYLQVGGQVLARREGVLPHYHVRNIVYGEA